MKMLKTLSDGKPHDIEDFRVCLMDELTEVTTIRQHISDMRKKLRLIGQDIICQWTGRTKRAYLHVELVPINQSNAVKR